MTDSLPTGWAWAILGDLTESVEQRGPGPGPTFRYIDIGALNNEWKRIDNAKILATVDAPSRARQNVWAGDVLVSMTRPNLNAVAIVPEPLGGAVASTGFHVLRSRYVEPGWLFAAVRSPEFVRTMSDMVKGALYPAVRPSDVRDYRVPVPPLAEQRRILAKLDQLFRHSHAARTTLEGIPDAAARHRASTIASALRGDLTVDWRRKNEGLTTIADYLDSDAARVRRVPPELDRPRCLPASWSWERLGSLGLDPEAAVQTGPFGAQLHRDEFVPDGVPVIAVGNLTGIGFTTDGLYHITPEKAAALARYDVQAGDLLFARSGATLGKVCVAPAIVRDWRMTGHILRARLDHRFVNPLLVVYALWADPVVKTQVTGGIRGMTRPGYNTTLLESIAIPLPPREEQEEIVRRIDAAFGRLDTLEASASSSMERLTELERVLLAKALRGELVPQDPTDEPAPVLMERVRAVASGSPPRARRARARA